MKTINFSDQVYEYAGLIPENDFPQPEVRNSNSAGKALVLLTVVLTVGVIGYMVWQEYQAERSRSKNRTLVF